MIKNGTTPEIIYLQEGMTEQVYGINQDHGLPGMVKYYREDRLIDDISNRLRYCIEYVNPRFPVLDNGKVNIRHLRIPDEHAAEMALTLMLSLGAKIYKLYRGNVKEGKLAEWPTPMIVDTDDWYSIDWLHNILDCGHLL